MWHFLLPISASLLSGEVFLPFSSSCAAAWALFEQAIKGKTAPYRKTRAQPSGLTLLPPCPMCPPSPFAALIHPTPGSQWDMTRCLLWGSTAVGCFSLEALLSLKPNQKKKKTQGTERGLQETSWAQCKKQTNKAAAHRERTACTLLRFHGWSNITRLLPKQGCTAYWQGNL